MSEYSMFGYTLRARKVFSFSWQKRLSVSSMLVHVSRAQYSFERTNLFFLRTGHGINFFEETQKSFQDVMGDVYWPTCPNEKCVYISTNKTSSFYNFKKCKACSHVLNNPFRDQKPTTILLGGDGTHCFARKTGREFEKEKPSSFWR